MRARSGALPQLSATASYDRALASEFEGVFDTESGSTCPPFALNPQAPIERASLRSSARSIAVRLAAGSSGAEATPTDSGGLNDLPFGRKNTWRASLSFSQNLYSGGRIGAQKEVACDRTRVGGSGADDGARRSCCSTSRRRTTTPSLSERLVAIAAATLDQAGATLKQTQAGFDAGTQPEFEVLRARVSRDNQSPVLIRQRANRDVALLRLKQLLELPADYPLQLADGLGDDAAPASAGRSPSGSSPVERALLPADAEAVSPAAGQRHAARAHRRRRRGDHRSGCARRR